MADEITLTAQLTYHDSGAEFSLGVDDLSITVAGSQIVHHRQSIGTSAEVLELAGLSTGGYFVAVNHDPTNYVEIAAAANAQAVVRLDPGDCACFRISGSAASPVVVADTAAVQIEYWLIEA
jgi:hypothetical protein